ARAVGLDMLHLCHLLCARAAIDVAEHAHPDLPASDVGSDVDGNALAFEPREILAEGRPIAHEAVGPYLALERLGARAEDWRGGLRFPEDFGGDALANFALRPAVHEQRVVAVAVEVNETRRDDRAC